MDLIDCWVAGPSHIHNSKPDRCITSRASNNQGMQQISYGMQQAHSSTITANSTTGLSDN